MKFFSNNLIIAICTGHFLFYLQLGIQNYLRLDNTKSTEVLATVILGQFQNIIVCFFLALLLFLSTKKKYLIISVLLLNFFLLFYLTLDQVFFGIFHHHFSLSYSEGAKLADIQYYWDSFISEINFSFYFNLALIFFIQFFVFRSLKNVNHLNWKINKKARYIILIFTVLSFLVSYNFNGMDINSYPLFSLIPQKYYSPSPKAFKQNSKISDLTTLRYGKQSTNDSNQSSLSSFLGKINARKKKPNIIFIILESVGYDQLFPNGEIDGKRTPNLAKLKSSSVLFNNIYNIFPGTTRSHIPISTGGRTITWGSVNQELLFPFKGTTLVGELRKVKYKTAWYSAMNMDFENLGLFYKSLGYDKMFDPDMEGEAFKKKYAIHSWGVDEDVIFDKANKWLVKQKTLNENTPVFLHLLTNTTHHPYGAPENYVSPFENDTNFHKYLTALNYTDSIIGKLVSKLKENHLLKDSLIVITGDHGEAFGEYHQGNFIHKNYLYEENIRNFLWVIDLSKDSPEIESKLRGDLGDVMPSILALSGVNIDNTPGKSLFSNYQEHLNFFYKNTDPEKWGLRDGRFKFISQIMDQDHYELYDLESDPREQNNIAKNFPERLELYDNLAASWYIAKDNEFTELLEGFQHVGKKSINISDIKIPGPRRMDFGAKINGEEFIRKELINPNEDMSIRTFGNSYPNGKSLIYKFFSPSGERRSFTFKFQKDWSTVYVNHNSPVPMEEGIWQAEIWDNNEMLVKGSFEVNKKAKLELNLFKKSSGPLHLSFGTKLANGNFIKLDTINPEEDLSAQILFKPYREKTKLDFSWRSPSGKEKSFWFNINKGWDKSWVYINEKNMETGTWTLVISHKNKELIRGSFNISKNAPLHRKFKEDS